MNDRSSDTQKGMKGLSLETEERIAFRGIPFVEVSVFLSHNCEKSRCSYSTKDWLLRGTVLPLFVSFSS